MGAFMRPVQEWTIEWRITPLDKRIEKLNSFWKDTWADVQLNAQRAENKGLDPDAAMLAILDAMHARWVKFASLTLDIHPFSFAHLLSAKSPFFFKKWEQYRKQIGKPIDLSYFAQKKAEREKLEAPTI